MNLTNEIITGILLYGLITACIGCAVTLMVVTTWRMIRRGGRRRQP